MLAGRQRTSPPPDTPTKGLWNPYIKGEGEGKRTGYVAFALKSHICPRAPL